MHVREAWVNLSFQKNLVPLLNDVIILEAPVDIDIAASGVLHAWRESWESSSQFCSECLPRPLQGAEDFHCRCLVPSSRISRTELNAKPVFLPSLSEPSMTSIVFLSRPIRAGVLRIIGHLGRSFTRPFAVSRQNW